MDYSTSVEVPLVVDGKALDLFAENLILEQLKKEKTNCSEYGFAIEKREHDKCKHLICYPSYWDREVCGSDKYNSCFQPKN
jgi:hypothetical protein